MERDDAVIDVPRMEPHGRLVQNVDEIDQVAVELPGHLHPLALAAGQRRHAAVERQVADADVDQVPQRPAHPGDQRRDDVADRFVVVPRDEVLEHRTFWISTPSAHSSRSLSAAVNRRNDLRGGTTPDWTISRQYHLPMS